MRILLSGTGSGSLTVALAASMGNDQWLPVTFQYNSSKSSK